MTVAGIRPCEREWTIEVAKGVHGMVEELTHKPCPFDHGGRCSVLPDEDAEVWQQDRQQTA